MNRRVTIGLLVFALLVSAIATACEPILPSQSPLPTSTALGETELQFETIIQGDHCSSMGSQPADPHQFLITNTEGINQLSQLIYPEEPGIRDQLLKLDYEHKFAIALFRGLKSSSGYTLVIERVAQQADKINVYAQYWEPGPHTLVEAVATSPCHIVAVTYRGSLIRAATLMLRNRTITPTPPPDIRK